MRTRSSEHASPLLLPTLALLLLAGMGFLVFVPIVPCPDCERWRQEAQECCFHGPDFWRRLSTGCPTCSKRGKIALLRYGRTRLP